MTFIAGKLFAEDGQLQATTDAVASSAQFIGGWAINQAGEAHVENLGADPVPSSAVFPDGMGIAFTQAGAMYVTTEDPSNAALIGGFAVRQDGALHVSGDDVEASDQLIGGWAFTQEGVARMGGVGLTALASIIAINGSSLTLRIITSEALSSLTDQIGFNGLQGTITAIPTAANVLSSGVSFATAAADGTVHDFTINWTGATSVQTGLHSFVTTAGPTNANVLAMQPYVAVNAGQPEEVITFTSAITPVTSATHGVPTGFSVPPVVGETGTLNNNIVLCPPDSEAVFAWLEDGTPNADTDTQYTAVEGDIGVTLATRVTVGAGVFTSTATQDVVSGVSPEAAAVIAAYAPTPSGARQTIIAALVDTLVADGIWAKLDRLWVLAAANDGSAGGTNGRINWISPGTDNLSISGDVFWAEDEGYTGDGGYLASATNLSSMSQYAQNSATIFAWVLAGTNETPVFGTNTSINVFLRPAAGGEFGSRVNSTGTLNATNSTIPGFFVATRRSSTAVESYIDGASVVTDTRDSDTVAAEAVTVLRALSTSTTNQVSVAGLGAQLSDAEVLDLNDALETYLTAIGAI